MQMVAPEIVVRKAEAGWDTFIQQGNSLPDETLQLALECSAVVTHFSLMDAALAEDITQSVFLVLAAKVAEAQRIQGPQGSRLFAVEWERIPADGVERITKIVTLDVLAEKDLPEGALTSAYGGHA